MELYELSAGLWAIAVAAAALFSLGGAFSNRLDILTHFAPIYALGGAIAIILQLIRGKGRARWAMACGAAAILAAGGLMAPEVVARVTAPTSAPRSQTLKIIELNLWSKNVDPAGTARWIAAQNPDIVVLEEVIGSTEVVPLYLRAAYPYQTPESAPFEATTFILSKTAPLDWGAYPSFDTFGRHSGAWARFGTGVGSFTIVGVHAPWPVPPGRQQAHTALLGYRLGAFDRNSVILAGDFNATPWSFSLRRQDSLLGLQRRDHALASWSVRPYSRYKLWTPFPIMPIDHIYAGASWKTVSVATGPKVGSDHLPIIAVLTR